MFKESKISSLMGGGTATSRMIVADNPYQINIEGRYDISCFRYDDLKNFKLTWLQPYTNNISKGWSHIESYNTTFLGSGVCPSNSTTLVGQFLNEILGFANSDYYYIGNDRIYLDNFQLIKIASDDGLENELYVLVSFSSFTATGEEKPNDAILDFYKKTNALSILYLDDENKVKEYDVNNLLSYENFTDFSFLIDGTIGEDGVSGDGKNIFFINKYSSQEEIEKAINSDYLLSSLYNALLNSQEIGYDCKFDFK